MAWFVSNPSFSLTLVARRLQSTTEDPTAGYTGVLFILGVFLFVCFSFSIRYFYAISNDVAIKRPGRLVKVDTQTSKVSSYLDAWLRKLNFGGGSFPEISPFRWRAGVRRTVTAQSQCTYRSLARQRKIPGCSSAPYSGQNQV